MDWFSDAAISGEDDIGDRPGFSAMLDRIEADGACTVIVEDASRFARKVLDSERAGDCGAADPGRDGLVGARGDEPHRDR